MAEAKSIGRRILETNPDNAEAYHLLGIIAHQSGNLAHAIEHVQRSTRLAPTIALYHANLGEMLRLAKRTDEAIAAGKRALEIDPTYADALSNLGIAYYEKDDFEQALAHYDRALALRPDFVEALSNRGNALRALKRLDDAISPIAARSICGRISPTPGTISRRRCAISNGPTRRRPLIAARWRCARTIPKFSTASRWR